jgi:hypothetical protein
MYKCSYSTCNGTWNTCQYCDDGNETCGEIGEAKSCCGVANITSGNTSVLTPYYCDYLKCTQTLGVCKSSMWPDPPPAPTYVPTYYIYTPILFVFLIVAGGAGAYAKYRSNIRTTGPEVYIAPPVNYGTGGAMVSPPYQGGGYQQGYAPQQQPQVQQQQPFDPYGYVAPPPGFNPQAQQQQPQQPQQQQEPYIPQAFPQNPMASNPQAVQGFQIPQNPLAQGFPAQQNPIAGQGFQVPPNPMTSNRSAAQQEPQQGQQEQFQPAAGYSVTSSNKYDRV